MGGPYEQFPSSLPTPTPRRIEQSNVIIGKSSFKYLGIVLIASHPDTQKGIHQPVVVVTQKGVFIANPSSHVIIASQKKVAQRHHHHHHYHHHHRSLPMSSFFP
jgi:hypothetical protein